MNSAEITDPSRIKRKAVTTISLLLLVNIAIWALTIIVFHHFPLLMGTAMLAYTFGLRHALDADHISAIDNVTRKLMRMAGDPRWLVSFSRSGIPRLSCCFLW
jgi:nickel/cobalt transporter (NiCoT) family protein